MKRYIRATSDIDNLLDSFNFDKEIEDLSKAFEEFGENDKDSKADFIAQHLYDMIHDITFEDLFDWVKRRL